jgi:hypothetical protein
MSHRADRDSDLASLPTGRPCLILSVRQLLQLSARMFDAYRASTFHQRPSDLMGPYRPSTRLVKYFNSIK